MSFKDSRFCVYLHKEPNTDKVFYVGQGSLSRAFSKTGRSSIWKETVKSFDNRFDVEIVQQNLSKENACELEYNLIIKYDNLINLRKSKSRVISLSFEELSKKFKIDRKSPSGLSYATEVMCKHSKKVGDPAGSIFKTNSKSSKQCKTYWKVTLKGVALLAHRVVYLLAHRSIDPDLVVDHINGNSLDNNIENLRLVTHKENCNSSKLISSLQINNKTGVNGVLLKLGKGTKSNDYVASFSLNGKRRTCSFSIEKYGNDEAFNLAVQWRKLREKEYEEKLELYSL